MIFRRSLVRELTATTIGLFVVLLAILFTQSVIRILGRAAGGAIAADGVLALIGFNAMFYLNLLLSVALFLTVLLTLSRWYRDSEMVIWFGSGVGLMDLVRPLFRFAWPILVAIAALALAALPWANEKIEGIRDHYEQRGDLDRVEPGRFQESADGRKVFFVEKNPSTLRTANSVFIATTDGGKETITTAGQGRVENRNNDQFLILSSGQRLENSIGKQDLKISEFAEYGTKVGTGRIDLKDNAPLGAIPSLDLLLRPTPRNLGELTWRLGFLLAAANLVIVALSVGGILFDGLSQTLGSAAGKFGFAAPLT